MKPCQQHAQVIKKPFYKKLYFQVIIAIFLGGIIGHFSPEFGTSLKPLGTGFIKLVKMVISPIIFLTIAHGIGSMQDSGKLRHVGTKAIGYFIILSTLALIFGMVAANIIRPGDGMNIVLDSNDEQSIAGFIKAGQQNSITEQILHIIPATLLSPFAEGEVIQVLFVAVIFGIALMKIGKPAQGIVCSMESLLVIIFKIVGMLMTLAPIGAFGAIAYTIGAHGIETIGNLAKLIATFYLTSAIFIVVILGSICRYHKIPMFKLLAYIKDELILVLGTSSSEPALPSLMQKLKKAGVSEASVG
jgi:aerobic C4-dicarboxylate transport protein